MWLNSPARQHGAVVQHKAVRVLHVQHKAKRTQHVPLSLDHLLLHLLIALQQSIKGQKRE
jgi:hypothetical protein